MSASFKLGMILLMVLTGGITTIGKGKIIEAFKIQTKQNVFEGQYFKNFFHPYMQAATMFLGQALSLPIFYFMKKKDHQTFKLRQKIAIEQGKELNFNVFLLVIPAALDLISSTLQYAAFSFVIGSIYQILKGLIIISTLLVSKFFLKRHLSKIQVVGSLIVFVGISIAAAANLVDSQGRDINQFQHKGIVGYIFILCSLVIASFYWAFQEKILRNYYVQPILMVGYEGLFGLILQIIAISIASNVPCSLSPITCAFNRQGQAYIQSPTSYFLEVRENVYLFMFTILGIFAVANFNIIGVTVTKNMNCVARSLCDATRVILSWLFGLLLTLVSGKYHEEFNWQIIDAGVISLKVFGFSLVVFGNIVYNRLVNIPWITGSQNYRDELQNKLVSETVLTSQATIQG